MAREMGMGVLPWSPLAGGILAGKYTQHDLGAAPTASGIGGGSRKAINLATGRLTERSLAIAGAVQRVAQAAGRPPRRSRWPGRCSIPR